MNGRVQIAVDARMIDSSGIGRVIENILVRMIPACPEWQFFLIGKTSRLRKLSCGDAENVRYIETDCPIYSVREQIVIPHLVPHDTDVFWTPHYNIPVLYRGTLVVTIHDLAHLALPQYRRNPLKRAYASFLFRAACCKASAIACVSRFTMRELCRYVPSADPVKLHLVYNGIDASWSHIPMGQPVYAKPFLLYVGNIKPHKNLRFLIRAFQHIADRVPYDLILVGRKEGFLTGDDTIGSLVDGWEDRIRFTGWVEDATLQQYVAQAEAMVFPSLYEGFGLPPLEALAAGTTILVSDIPVMREVCGEDAVYFDPRDEKSLADEILCLSEMKRDCKREHKIKYHWEDTTRQMISLLEKSAKGELPR